MLARIPTFPSQQRLLFFGFLILPRKQYRRSYEPSIFEVGAVADIAYICRSPRSEFNTRNLWETSVCFLFRSFRFTSLPVCSHCPRSSEVYMNTYRRQEAISTAPEHFLFLSCSNVSFVSTTGLTPRSSTMCIFPNENGKFVVRETRGSSYSVGLVPIRSPKRICCRLSQGKS